MKEKQAILTAEDCEWAENGGNCLDCPYYIEHLGTSVFCSFDDCERETEGYLEDLEESNLPY